MRRVWRAGVLVAAASFPIAATALGGEPTTRRPLAGWMWPGFRAQPTHPTIPGVMAAQSPPAAVRPGWRPHGRGRIPPFGAVQTGLESGIGYGYPTLYARPGWDASRGRGWGW